MLILKASLSDPGWILRKIDEQEPVSTKDLQSPSTYKPLIVGSMLMIFQQLCGINVILFYCAKIFDTAGIKDAKLVSLSVAGAMVLATIVACIIVDKVGRKILLILSGIVMGFCNVLLGFYFDIAKFPGDDEQNNISMLGGHISHSVALSQISWVAVLSIIFFIIFFSFGFGPLPWLLMSEIFPSRVRGMASGFVTLVNWTFVFITTNTFNATLALLHEQGTFLLFGFLSFLSFIYTIIWVPETKGKTLEEVEELFVGTRA